jgi:hypothetical protein
MQRLSGRARTVSRRSEAASTEARRGPGRSRGDDALRRAVRRREPSSGVRQNATMWTDELHVSGDVSAAEWIAPRLGGEFGSVTLAVPDGYPAYVRICHPAADGGGASVTWPEVAKTTGRRAHALMQWHALVGSPDPFNVTGSSWPGREPETGNLTPDALGPLCDVLAEHTGEPGRCRFCLWEGWGWVDGSGTLGQIVLSQRDEPVTPAKAEEIISPAFSAEELARERVRLPGRDYLLLEGPLSAAVKIGYWGSSTWFLHQSPNLFWPADRAWCVASEIDYDSTLIGGSTGLIETILDAPRFDAWPVAPTDSLAYDADKINAAA